MLNRLQNLGLLDADKACESALVSLLEGPTLWEAKGCCVSVKPLVVAQSDPLCVDGMHLESAKKRGGKIKIRPCLCGLEEVSTRRIEHWQCAQCAEFARCVYTLALACPTDLSRRPYDRICAELREGVKVINASLGLIYDIYESDDDKNETDILWDYLVEELAQEKCITQDTLTSIIDFAENVTTAAKTPALVNFNHIFHASKQLLQKRRRSP